MGVCDYTYDEDKMQVKVNCLGCLYGSSVEDHPECMARVIDIILEVKKVTSIILARTREYEYDYSQVKMLTEVAGVIEYAIREKLLSYGTTTASQCTRCYPEWNSMIQYIVLDLMRKDPIGAYVELVREIRRIKTKIKTTKSRVCYNCYRNYKENVLDVLKEKLGSTKLIRSVEQHLTGYHVGDRSLYRDLFMPSVRPNFMLTRYMIAPPEGGKSVDRYKIGDTQVEIFKLPHTAQYLYLSLIHI